MTTVITDAYSPTNVGDEELVQRAVDHCRRHRSGEIIVLATDPVGFIARAERYGTGVRFIRKPLSRLGWRASNRAVALRWLFSELLTLILAHLVSSVPFASIARRRRWSSGVGQIMRSDWLLAVSAANSLVAVGGGYLGDRYRRETFVALLVYRLGNNIGASVQTMPVSISSANRPAVRMAFRVLGSAVCWRSRDLHTHRLLAELGISSHLVPDLAWLNALATRPAGREGRAGVVIAPVGARFYTGESDNAASLDELIVSTVTGLEESEPVKFLAMHRTHRELRDGGDEIRCQQLAQHVQGAFPRLVVEIVIADGYEEVIATMARSRLVISERLHAAIAAITCGTPTVILPYEPKHTSVLRLAKLTDLLDPEIAVRASPVTLHAAAVAQAWQVTNHLDCDADTPRK